MARGIFTKTLTISANADTTLVAAPTTSGFGAPERIYVQYLKIEVSVAGTTSRAYVSDGVSGAVLMRAATTSADAIVESYYAMESRNYPGWALSEATLLNVNTTGGAAATIEVTVIYEVK